MKGHATRTDLAAVRQALSQGLTRFRTKRFEYWFIDRHLDSVHVGRKETRTDDYGRKYDHISLFEIKIPKASPADQPSLFAN